MNLLVNFLAPPSLFDSISSDSALNADCLEYQWRHFPDGESCIRILGDCAGHDVTIIAGLDDPDPKILPLLLLADTLRDLGATSIGLVAAYLPYMRQDVRFNAGEGVSARYFPRVLERPFDWLVTVDPHLHRVHDLSEIYSIDTLVAGASEPIADWIQANVKLPVLVGPDEESRQWVEAIAERAHVPYVVMQKRRSGDRQVTVELTGAVSGLNQRQPVLVDDMVSTGNTIIQAAGKLQSSGMRKPLSICVHGLYVDGLTRLQQTCAGVVSCNSIAPKAEGMARQINLSGVIVRAMLTRLVR